MMRVVAAVFQVLWKSSERVYNLNWRIENMNDIFNDQ